MGKRRRCWGTGFRALPSKEVTPEENAKWAGFPVTQGNQSSGLWPGSVIPPSVSACLSQGKNKEWRGLGRYPQSPQLKLRGTSKRTGLEQRKVDQKAPCAGESPG